MGRALTLSIVGLALGPCATQAQVPDLSAYYFTLASHSGGSPIGESGSSDFQRLRLMWSPAVGPLRFSVAYEHTLQVRGAGVLGTGAVAVVPEAGTNWLDLDWTAARGDHALWRHRLDRVDVTLPVGESAEVTVGRQVVSWASTLILTPADPFTPFDPADPFREYRAGVDAVRLRVYPGAFSEVDLVVRPVEVAGDHYLTALLRGATNWGGLDVAAWGGVLFDEAAGALSAVGALGGWAVRTEVSLREGGDGAALRGTIGVDRRFSVAGRDLYLIVEYQRDGFGAAGADELLPVAASEPFRRGELQLFAQDALASQVSYQIAPLWAVDLLAIGSLVDGSVLLSGGGSWGLGSNSSLRAGFFIGVGDDAFAPDTGLGSEFGPTPTVLYLSLTHFF